MLKNQKQTEWWLFILTITMMLMVNPFGSSSMAATTDTSNLSTEDEASAVEEASEVTETTIEVKAKALKEGSAESGYRAEKTTVGPLGKKKILDTPYVVQSLSSDMIENRQATSFREMVQYLPSAQIEERGGPDVGRPQTRGFQGTVVENNRLDGMNMVATTALPMEMFERIDVLNGITGSLYGPANPSGTFDFVLKRPTEEPLRQINLKYNYEGNITGHVDVGDSFGARNQFGYRFNALYGDGEGYVDDSTLRRKMACLSLDWHPFEHTVVEANFSYYRFIKKGFAGGFAVAPTLELPDAMDATRTGYGQEWAGSDLETLTASGRIKHDFNENWHAVVGFLDQAARRDFFMVTNTLLDNQGTYRTTVRAQEGGRHDISSYIAYLNGKVHTGWLTHDLSIGSNGWEWRRIASKTSSNYVLGTSSISDPASYDEPDWNLSGDNYNAGYLRSASMTLGDTVTFDQHWSVMLSGSHSWIESKTQDKNGNTTASQDDNGFSGSASLIYKPRENMSVYFTYADSFQPGETAPAGADNEYETMAPYRSDQYELGFKMNLAQIDFSTALFRIERPFAYTDPDDNVFKVSGNQVNYGLELMASGNITRDLHVYGGMTFLKPKLKDTGDSDTRDKQVIGVPKFQANILVEYDIRQIKGLSVNCNFHHTGRRPINSENSSWAESYNTIDLGARYTTRLAGKKVTWRVAVNNITDEEYWSGIFSRNINGGSSASSLFLGRPREVFASMTVDL
jgi:iron complex outermembrane receptor protein